MSTHDGGQAVAVLNASGEVRALPPFWYSSHPTIELKLILRSILNERKRREERGERREERKRERARERVKRPLPTSTLTLLLLATVMCDAM